MDTNSDTKPNTTGREFYIELQPYVDRCIVIQKDFNSEMKEGSRDETKVIMNGMMPDNKDPVTLMIMIGNLGDMMIDVPKLFSRPLSVPPQNVDPTAQCSNAIMVNFHIPEKGILTEVSTPKECILEFPQLLQDVLGLPSLMRLDAITKPDTMPDDIKDRGLDPDAGGWFGKKINHKYPTDVRIIELLNKSKVKLTLYQDVQLKEVPYENRYKG